jgi:hypothetical protein
MSGKNKNMVMGSDGAQNQERLCWRGPAVIYGTGLAERDRRQTDQSESKVAVRQPSPIPRKRNDCVGLDSLDIRHRRGYQHNEQSSCRKKKRKTKKKTTWSRRVSNEEHTPASWAVDE